MELFNTKNAICRVHHSWWITCFFMLICGVLQNYKDSAPFLSMVLTCSIIYIISGSYITLCELKIYSIKKHFLPLPQAKAEEEQRGEFFKRESQDEKSFLAFCFSPMRIEQ